MERLELARPARCGLVQPRVLDRDGRLRREQLDDLLVLRGELGAILLLGQVEVSEGDASQHDRNAEEGVHRGMVRRKADCAWIPGQVGESQRRAIADQDSEDPASPRQIADRSVRLVVDAVREESLQLGSVRVDDAERGVPCACQRRGGLHHVLEHAVERELGRERDACIEQ